MVTWLSLVIITTTITWGHAGPLGHMTHHMICRNAFSDQWRCHRSEKQGHHCPLDHSNFLKFFEIFRRLRGECFVIWIMPLQSYKIDLSWPFMTGPNFTLTQEICVKSVSISQTGVRKSMFQDQFRENVHFKDGQLLRPSALLTIIILFVNSEFLGPSISANVHF